MKAKDTSHIGMIVGAVCLSIVFIVCLVDSALECSNHNYGESSNQQSEKHETYTLKSASSSQL